MGMWDSSKERIDYFKRCRELNAELKAEREKNANLEYAKAELKDVTNFMKKVYFDHADNELVMEGDFMVRGDTAFEVYISYLERKESSEDGTH